MHAGPGNITIATQQPHGASVMSALIHACSAERTHGNVQAIRAEQYKSQVVMWKHHEHARTAQNFDSVIKERGRIKTRAVLDSYSRLRLKRRPYAKIRRRNVVPVLIHAINRREWSVSRSSHSTLQAKRPGLVPEALWLLWRGEIRFGTSSESNTNPSVV
jgi:hypothetical protein